MLTKRRSAPCSSTTRALMPGKVDSSESMTSVRVEPLAVTCDWSWVYVRRIVGIRTLMLTVLLGVVRVSGDVGGQEGLVGWRDGGCWADQVGDGVEGFEAVARVDDDRLEVRVELTRLGQLLQHTHRGAARGLGEYAFRTSQQHDRLTDVDVGDVGNGATRLAADVEDVHAVGGIADRERLGDRVGAHRTYDVPALPERLGDRGAPCGLGTEHLVRLVLHQPERDELLERLVDLGQLRAGRDRDDNLVGQAPAELLGDLIAERLRPLGIERAHVDVDERPALLFTRDLRGELVDVVIVAVDGDEVFGVDR